MVLYTSAQYIIGNGWNLTRIGGGGSRSRRRRRTAASGPA